jgi:hypothetical protein
MEWWNVGKMELWVKNGQPLYLDQYRFAKPLAF